MAVRRRPACPVPTVDAVGEQLHRLASRWVAMAIDPDTPETRADARAHLASNMAEIAGRRLTKTEIRQLHYDASAWPEFNRADRSTWVQRALEHERNDHP